MAYAVPGSSLALPRLLRAPAAGWSTTADIVVVGSGIAAQRLSPSDTGLQLLQNSLTTVFGLGVLILWFGPVSGAHFNPVVSAVDWAVGRRTRTGLPGRDVFSYTAAQVLGGIGGAVLANVMFGLAAAQISQHVRSAPGLWLGELVATAASDRAGRPEPVVRTGIELSWMVVGLLLGGTVGVGTVLVAMLIGPAVRTGQRSVRSAVSLVRPALAADAVA